MRIARGIVVAAIGVSAMGLCGLLGAQEKSDRAHPGKWTPAPPIQAALHGTVPAADATAGGVWLNAIFDMLHRIPLLAQPKGFDVFPRAILELDSMDGRTGPRAKQYLYGIAEVDLGQYEHGTANEREAPATIRIEVNHLGPVIDGALLGSEADDAADDHPANRTACA